VRTQRAKKGRGKSIRRLAATFILKQNTTRVSPSRLINIGIIGDGAAAA
jgi:hypothetical protein